VQGRCKILEKLKVALQFLWQTTFISTPTPVIVISNFEKPKDFTWHVEEQPPKAHEQINKEEEGKLEETANDLREAFFRKPFKK
jgi:hypothetical protein